MQIRSLSTSLTTSGADCLIIFVNNEGQLLGQGNEVDESLDADLNDIANSDLLQAEAGSHVVVPFGGEGFTSILLYRLGKKSIPVAKYSTSIKKLASIILGLKAKSAAADLTHLKASSRNADELIGSLITEIHQQSYRFENYKSKKKPKRPMQTLIVGHEDSSDCKTAVARAKALAGGIKLARDLGNMPGNDCTPNHLAQCADELASELNFEVDILDEEAMTELGMGSLLSVSAGSAEPAHLIVMKYKGSTEDEAPHVLVGKGITFDTGGISLKPGAAMDEMKYDMCGAASVFGATQAVVEMKLPINLIAIVAAAENMPSGIATKPGDIVTSMSGKTIEVLNTDAEGRLVLCDALTYAEQFNPASIVDIATLTGAVIIALGRHAAGLYANDDNLAAALTQAGEKTGDRVWRMPLWKEYVQQLESPFADLANIGGRDAGSVTAACFLSQFTEKQNWAHLDIAGTAWRGGKAKGATGSPVKLLVEYLRSVCE